MVPERELYSILNDYANNQPLLEFQLDNQQLSLLKINNCWLVRYDADIIAEINATGITRNTLPGVDTVTTGILWLLRICNNIKQNDEALTHVKIEDLLY